MVQLWVNNFVSKLILETNEPTAEVMDIESVHFSHKSFRLILFIVDIYHGRQQIQTYTLWCEWLIDEIALVEHNDEGFKEIDEIGFRKLWVG